MIRQTTNRNLTHQLVHDLGIAIVQGRYAATQKLPSEADICQQYNVSRTSTREAVKMLTAKGMIVSRPRQGITIQDRQNWNMFDPDILEWLLDCGPDLTTLLNFLQLRLAIEPEAASLAARVGTPEQIADIQLALNRIEKAEKGLDDVLAADIEFHTHILQASNNPFFNQMQNFIEAALRVAVRFNSQVYGLVPANYRHHLAIYQAIVEQDAEKAFEASRTLQMQAIQQIEKLLKSEEIPQAD